MKTTTHLVRPRMNRVKHIRYQAGLSLIELMVAVVIGLFLTLGLSTMFLNMYSASQSQGSVNQALENQRLALVMLTNTVQLSGYFYYNAGASPAITSASTVLVPLAANNADSTNFIAGQGIVGTGTGTGVGAASDTLNIYYETAASGIDNVINCQGGTNTASTAVTFVNSFSINSSYQLVCTVRTNGGTPSNPLVLANNVHSMSIMYGVDGLKRINSPASTTTAYMDASDVTVAGDWPYVRSVQVTLNFFTPNPLQPNLPFTASSPTTPWVQTINLMSKS